MSGGPVFDMKGRVYGMDVATLTRKIPEANGIETIVPNGVAIDVVTIKKILTSKITLT
jgi:S1-C subfamily serine protease